ncbi:hypothetical protein, variant 1 [Aphanomyces invadans]|uniref:Fe/B12 periplasmic-binding domain-containing protein n=1 Tax=Aphanomyces invadans TaxID=157072 RepID=A0A024UAI1_9STRA|nr:hypothetical protein, variant 1 [Aphanomyces invadans]ETW03230.1 hypothetical protein, variant 1 [Aphanomyces invadans]|eukprot:XP_008868614.1 hypothetical protein, variant 1 [Aphanomyces invadans]
MRIASFLPAGTTICFELGLGDEVACVSFECKFPPAAKDKPKVIRCIFNSDDLTSAEIECAVTTNLAASVPLYEIDESLLKDVDVVLIQDLCEVCAIGPPMVLAVLEKLQVQPRVVYLTARTLEGLYKDVMSVATACDVEERGIAMVESMRARVNRVERALVDCTPVKTVCVEWLDPIYNAGHWMPDLVHRAGGYDPLAAPESFSVAVNWTHVAEAGAEVLVIMPCGFDLARTIKDATETLSSKPGWRDIPAVRSHRVWAFDGNRLFSGASPALVDGLEILASILHPNLYTLGTPYANDFSLLDI